MVVTSGALWSARGGGIPDFCINCTACVWTGFIGSILGASGDSTLCHSSANVIRICHRHRGCHGFLGLSGDHWHQRRKGDDRMNKLLYEMQVAAKQAPRLYFAPFVGAVMAMKKEVRALRRSSRPATTKDPRSKVSV